MNREAIEREVRRLSPWYYRFDVDGVGTDITPPCDRHGHREVELPESAELLLRGKTVLDVGCNEGGFSFRALERGASSVEGFDVRAINIEKARFVARIRGHANASFSVDSCDRWFAANRGREFDYVLLCGLLYHLPRPWETIRQYCSIAQEGVFVVCVLQGGPDGYTPFPEQENIAASEDPGQLSMMPNTSRTLIDEFARHGFSPAFIAENREGFFWGGCSLLFRNCSRRFAIECLSGAGPEDLGLYLAPAAREGEVLVVVYNWSSEARELDGYLDLSAGPGAPLRLGPHPLRLAPRVAARSGSASSSIAVPVRLGRPTPESTIDLHLTARGAPQPICTRRIRIRS